MRIAPSSVAACGPTLSSMTADLSAPERAILADLWASLGGPPETLESVVVAGEPGGLPSVYRVGESACAQVAAATLAVAELFAVRSRTPRRRVRVERRHVVAAFRSERYLHLASGARDPWDPIAGDYEAEDRWIRLHTNYANHRRAVLEVLGTPADRDAVARAVRGWKAEELETKVVEAGGAAAAMHTAAEWNVHPQGAAVALEPLVDARRADDGGAPAPFETLARVAPKRPLDGVRVLDLTRVIAGPVCTRFLAAHGAEVLRIDPPGFEEVGALLGDTTGGKRRAALDLRSEEGRRTFRGLLAEAHLLVTGYRGDALSKLGFDAKALRADHPGLVIASLDAYGWTGPWASRRGFDSLVQMSAGIAARGAEVARSPRPSPLPAQALDHGTGYLLAAAACRALTQAVQGDGVRDVRLSLARTAHWLMRLGEAAAPGGSFDFSREHAAPWLETTDSVWGTLQRVRAPGEIEGLSAFWTEPPGPLGSDRPAWKAASNA